MFRRGRRVAVAIAAVLLAAGVVASCSDDDEERVLTIGVIAPLEDGLVDFGRDIRNGVELAVDAANEHDAVPGWRIELRALDDSSDPATGRRAAEQLARDETVVGVVGTYNSGVAREVAPVLDEAGIVMLSPGNTDPALTKGDDPGRPERQWDHYFRMVAADDVQGPFLARQAAGSLGFERAAVISETKPVSKGLADAFASVFADEGGDVVLREVVADGTESFADVVAAIAPLRPDVVFFGGEYQVAAELRRQATAGGVTAPLMGGDGIKDDAYVEAAGAAAENDLASSIGQPVAESEHAEDYLADLKGAGFGEAPGDFGPSAFDAANVIIAAAAEALADADADELTAEVRGAVLDAVAATDVDGASGPVAFDELGDARTKVLTLYRVEDGAWVAEETEELGADATG